ncbi:hypothetical protein FDUTEX481_05103 [Tolypothrix sp. PCC 7601]|nr:hypothetical protein FDUTEX481_05103 [Tolypothrix sp. PCC 7601]
MYTVAHQERGARDLIPLLLREKGLGDEGEGFCTTPALYSFKLKLTPMGTPCPLEYIDVSQTLFDLVTLIKEARRIGGFSPKPPIG